MVSLASVQLFNLIQICFLLGFNFTLSYVAIPTILVSPSPILAIRQWDLLFPKGRIIGTPMSATSLIVSLILAWATRPGAAAAAAAAAAVSRKASTKALAAPPEITKPFLLYCASSILAFFVFPFTIRYMNPLNDYLIEKCKTQSQLHYAELPEKNAGMQTARVSLIWTYSLHSSF